MRKDIVWVDIVPVRARLNLRTVKRLHVSGAFLLANLVSLFLAALLRALKDHDIRVSSAR